jgi:hypothetical protein
MATKSHNAKKPKLAGHHLGSAQDEMPAVLAGEKHKMSFAQHQHEQQLEHTASAVPLPEAPTHQLKSDAQQHQQKPYSHK